jgi:hypothetical protein
MKVIFPALIFAVLGAASASAHAQTSQNEPASSLISKSTTAIGFTVGGGNTKVDLRGSELMPQANDEAKVQAKAKAGLTNIEVTVKGLTPPSKLTDRPECTEAPNPSTRGGTVYYWGTFALPRRCSNSRTRTRPGRIAVDARGRAYGFAKDRVEIGNSG